MSLRRRLALIAAASVAVAVLIAAMVCYLVVRDQLRSQVDTELIAQASAIQHGQVMHLGGDLPGLPASAGGPAPYTQAVSADGQTTLLGSNLTLPVSASTLDLAHGNGNTYLSDVHVGSSHLREIAFSFVGAVNGAPQTLAIQLARPLNGVDGILANLRLVLAFVVLGGIALAAALGRLAGRRVLAPLAEVASAAQHIGETDDLSRRIRVHADDEVGQLATRFNSMLDRLEGSRAALDESVRAQRQLVADASHELRTPVTSIRTNIEILERADELPPGERSRLISDLIELARGDEPGFATEDVRLDGVAAESLARARRNAPEVSFTASLAPVSMDGVPARLERAINTLLDNAARHSPPGAPVELTVDADGIRVRDHGPGIVPDDLPYVFDRFFRGTNARGRQGSGLGLAIVRQVTEQHGGTASAVNAEDGGAMFTLHLPVSAAADDAAPEEVHAPTG